MSEENENGNENRSAMAAAQEIVNGGVQSVSVGGRTVQNVGIQDLIALEKFQKEQAAAKNPALGLRSVKLQGGSTRY